MIKYLLLVVLALPVGWIGYDQVRSDLIEEPLAVPAPGPFGGEVEKQLTVARDKGRQVAEVLPTDVLTAVARIQETCPELGPNATQLTRAIQMHARKLDHALSFVRCLNTEGKAGIQPEEPEFRDFLRNLTDLRETRREIENLRQAYQGGNQEQRDAFEQRLKKYSATDGCDETFCAEVRAHVDFSDLQWKYPNSELDDLYQKLEQWMPGDRMPTPARASDAVRAWSRFANEHHEVVPFRVKAGRQLDQWRYGLDLFRILKTGQTQLEKVQAIGDLIQGAGASAPERFARVARSLAGKLCADYLPKQLDLDRKLYLYSQDGLNEGKTKEELVERDKLGAIWKDSRGASQLLKETKGDARVDEFHLDALQLIECFTLHKGGVEIRKLPKTGAPLKPTPYSKAVNEYNTRRKDLRWDADSVTELKSKCKAYEGDLKKVDWQEAKLNLWDRIDRLITVVTNYRELFTDAGP